MLYNFQLIRFAKFRHMAILAVFCGYFGYFAIMLPKYFEPKLVPNCCPKGTWYFPVCHTPCTFIPTLLEVLAQLCPLKFLFPTFKKHFMLLMTITLFWQFMTNHKSKFWTKFDKSRAMTRFVLWMNHSSVTYSKGARTLPHGSSKSRRRSSHHCNNNRVATTPREL